MRPIDADAVYPAFVELFKGKIEPSDVRFSMNDIKNNLDNIPTIEMPQQPEIVRCKDCVYFPEGTGANHHLEFPEGSRCPCQCDDYWYSWKPADDWYCANGKRKENES